ELVARGRNGTDGLALYLLLSSLGSCITRATYLAADKSQSQLTATGGHGCSNLSFWWRTIGITGVWSFAFVKRNNRNQAI
ncbi:unnamed protein product, partial [Urochloa humidicola]